MATNTKQATKAKTPANGGSNAGKAIAKLKAQQMAKTAVKPISAAILPMDALTRIRANKISTVTQYAPAATIAVVSKACPHKQGSFRAGALACAHKAKTVGAYMANNVKGQPPLVKYKYLGRWAAMGLLTIG
jgi:hypothetical protein